MPSPRKSEIGLDNVKPASSVTLLFVGLSFTALAEGWCHAILDVHQDRQGAQGAEWGGV